MALAPRQQLATAPPSHSIMEDESDTESDPDLDAHLDPDQQQFYARQQEQAFYYQQHQKQHGSSTDVSSGSNRQAEDEEVYSDDDSSTASIPDDDINFELTYALHTFLATVEGQASVVKGDSLVLLDDANSYWWLVRVLKTEDVGYIPAENIETPYERLARLNKHRNVDLAAATQQEKQAEPRLKGVLTRKETSDEGRRVIFAPPTYVDHPGVTWSSDESDGEYEESVEGEEPDDGVEWADDAVEEQQSVQPTDAQPLATFESNSSIASSLIDPAEAGETRRITVTPSVAQSGPLLPSEMVQARSVSGQSTSSLTSIVSTGSVRSDAPSSPEDGKKGKKMKKSSKEDLGDGEKRRSKGVLSGLFSRNKDKKKGISSNDPRTSEDSIESPATIVRASEGLGFRVQQRDQALQQAYTDKYLTKSAEHTPTTSEAAVVAQNAALRSMGGNRPSSIILSPNPAGPPLLNVIRVFAGDHIKSDSSFKTVLLNETTTGSDLIRQLMQRFRLQADSGYYLTIKDVSGEEMELEPGEKPLAAFEEAVQRWAEDDTMRARTPTIKRSSISSISSISSLSSHPAIAKLGMNDFSDDSTVKIYLNRRDVPSYPTQLSTVQESAHPRYNLTIQTSASASPERFTSPSAKFTLQLLVHPGDLPDGSVFDPSSDAIIPRQTAREGSGAFSMDSRKRLFTLPRNATVVEAIEQGLERFGIKEGVVDGGDDVDKRLAKVRYSLVAVANGQERQLSPSSKVLDAYTTPPQLRPVERTTPEQRRRSRDLSINAGSQADILPTDPVFVLRRVRASAQEIIAAQRAASRASQKALISAHVNTDQGVDVVLPDRGTVRSSRLLVPNGEVVRYSFIDGDGETYDISEMLEEEWGPPAPLAPPAPPLQRMPTDSSNYVTAPSTPEPTEDKRLGEKRGSRDILQGVLRRPDGEMEEKLHRVINKVKESTTSQARAHQTAVDVNRIISRHRQQPSIASILSDLSADPHRETPADRSSTPLTATSSSHPTPTFSNIFTRNISSASSLPRTPVSYTDDFGIKTLLAIVEIRSRDGKPRTHAVECDDVERRLYGENIDWDGVHEEIRGVFSGVAGRLERFDRDIDEVLASVLKTR